MIKLDLPPKPDKLTKELQERWTQKFIANPDKSKGWDDIRDNNPWLQEALFTPPQTFGLFLKFVQPSCTRKFRISNIT